MSRQPVLLPCFKLFAGLFCFTLSILAAHAQTAALKGRIRTRDGQPAAYVNVALKETAKGTTTNEKGDYWLKNVPAGSYTVVTSSVGLRTQEIPNWIRSSMSMCRFPSKVSRLKSTVYP
jgi:hypothetical protein